MKDLTQGTFEQKHKRAKKMMLWFGIISLIMTFAGWTSAYVVSSSREDWLHEMQLPTYFTYSLIVILLSSVTFILAKRFLIQNKRSQTTIFLMITFVLGLAFLLFQLLGFSQIVETGYHFTGPTSNVTMSFVFLIAFVHLLHLVVGLISLIVVIYNHFKFRYSPENHLGFQLSATFWHFVDILWVYLFLFLYFS